MYGVILSGYLLISKLVTQALGIDSASVPQYHTNVPEQNLDPEGSVEFIGPVGSFCTKLDPG